MKLIKPLLGLAAIGVLGAVIFVYFGVFNTAADEPHSKPFFWLMETTRQRSIAMRAKGIKVPPLADPAMITSGGADYNEMCTGCHLQPGVDDTELRSAMYPQPPNLTKVKRDDPAQTFWIIKHGVKMSAMPAWGATHDDQRMWAMVAFLQQLPRLTPVQYQILTAPSEEDTEGRSHGGMEGMNMPADHHRAEGHDGQHGEGQAHLGGGKPGMDMPSKNASHADSDHGHESGGDGTPAGAVDNFLKALASGNAKDAQRWLAPDVLVYESGHAENSRDQYVSEHMKGDMEFLSKAKIERLEQSSNGGANIAWVTSRTRIRGQSGGKPLDVISTETMVLTSEKEGWRIKHIHWSSADTRS